MNHKSDDYKLNDMDYYLTEDKSQEEVCKIFKGAYEIPEKYVEKNKTRKRKLKNYKE